MVEAEGDISENLNTSTRHDWPTAKSCPPVTAQQASPALPQPCPEPQPLTLLHPSPARLETESSCMEIEAAQRKLQEIEDRYAI